MLNTNYNTKFHRQIESGAISAFVSDLIGSDIQTVSAQNAAASAVKRAKQQSDTTRVSSRLAASEQGVLSLNATCEVVKKRNEGNAAWQALGDVPTEKNELSVMFAEGRIPEKTLNALVFASIPSDNTISKMRNKMKRILAPLGEECASEDVRETLIAWMTSEYEGKQSFLYLCDEALLDPDDVRVRVLHLAGENDLAAEYREIRGGWQLGERATHFNNEG